MTDEEEAYELATKYASYDDTFQDCFDTAIDMAAWKDEQFTKIGYTKEQLLSMGFGFTLNGDIITQKEEEEMTKEYIEHQKQQMIKKACEYIFDNWHGEKVNLYMIESFKKTMEGE